MAEMSRDAREVDAGSARVAIADLGIGNFAALAKMVERLGASARRVADPSGLADASHVILPGVGAFDFAARVLDQGGWREPLLRILTAGDRPVLCVCVGMQLLATGSAEGPGAGLGYLAATCERLPDIPGLKIPHMGWNTLQVRRPSALFPGDEESRFYFVHSYVMTCANPEDIGATAHYGTDFPAVVARGAVTGVQFHPEKSHRFGLRLIERFLATSC